MVTIVFIVFLGACALAGIVISVMAKRRNDGSQPRSSVRGGDAPQIGRASGGGDD
jgi:hypothetical protein